MAGLISIVVLVAAALHAHSPAPLKHLPLALGLVIYGLYDEIAPALRRRRPRREHAGESMGRWAAPAGAGASAQLRARR